MNTLRRINQVHSIFIELYSIIVIFSHTLMPKVLHKKIIRILSKLKDTV